MIATVTARDAVAVGCAAELGSGTFSVLMAAEFVFFVVAVGAIVFEITRPAARYAALILALEFGRLVTFRTLLRQFVRA